MNRALPAALLFALAGCPTPTPDPSTGDPGTTPAPDPITWKPGTTVLFTPTAERPEPRLQDAARDGDRVLVLVSHARGNTLYVSEDQGATFRSLDVPRARDAGVELPASVTDDLLVLQPTQGRVFLLARGVRTTDSEPFWQAMELDLATGHYAGTARLPYGRLFLRGGVVVAYGTRSVRGVPTALYGRVDLVAGSLDVRSATFALGPGRCVPDGWTTANGTDFFATCSAGLPEPGTCLLHADATSLAPAFQCFPRGFWPVQTPVVTRPWAAVGGGLFQVHPREGGTWATALTPGTPPGVATWFIGSGAPFATGAGFSDREPFAGLYALSTGTGTLDARVVAWTTIGGALELPMPLSPCAVDARCFTGREENALRFGTGSLARLVSLGSGKFLAVHVVRDDLERPGRSLYPLGAWDYVVVRMEQVTPVPFADPEPQVPDSPLPGYPGATEASALEAVCARLVACYPGATFPTGGKLDLRACTTSWLSAGTREPTQDLAYQRFVATPAGDCEAFHDSWPQVLGPRVVACGCQGDVAVTCPSGATGGIYDCRQRGLGCVLDAQNRPTCAAPGAGSPGCNTCDAAGRATTCIQVPPAPALPWILQADCGNLGLSCVKPDGVLQPYCRDATLSCPADGAGNVYCSGDLAYGCAGNPAASGERRDCTRTGQVCAPGKGCVTQLVRPPACGVPGEQCQGPYLSWCLGGSPAEGPVRWLDCRSLGYRTCAMTSDPVEPHATCVP